MAEGCTVDALMVVEGCESALSVPLCDRELLSCGGRAVEVVSYLYYHRDSLARCPPQSLDFQSFTLHRSNA